ncbi:serine carboxypeptidase-like 16 [Phalaenopsis equestris]|uniref:serine carboxypeptidase-like 16 n=1 Tax=Phalaenopsis equestris TaxID=78828 RepID=UPI0009E1C1C3|nr:serine carboxypeptidase-like 16 [Phalaenopsis equestris]
MKFFFFVFFFVLLFLQQWLHCLSAVNYVTHLPGFQGELPFHLETGYVSIDDDSGAELFYYFVRSDSKPEEDPLILWLSGGPGCSGFVGLALEMGPLHFKVDTFDGNIPTLVVNPYSWTKIANMIFLDWPVGTGFSYSMTDKDYITEDIQAKENILKFLRKWFLRHPNFMLNPFYMGGDSYGGKMATLVSHDIVEENEQGQKPLINIKGYLIGNTITGEKIDINSQVPHAYGLGIISEELYELIQKNCVGEDYDQPQGAVCKTHLQAFNAFLSKINVFGILEPLCSNGFPGGMLRLHRSLEENSPDFVSQSSPDNNCITSDLLANYWANNQLVRNVLQIKEGTVGRWYGCNLNVSIYNYSRLSIPSSLPYHRSLTTRGYRALVYSGDHDLQVSFVGTLEWIKSLRYIVLDPWRSWHAVGQVAGYTILFGNNLTFATVKGGNHLAPANRPLQSFVMFERWISQQIL